MKVILGLSNVDLVNSIRKYPFIEETMVFQDGDRFLSEVDYSKDALVFSLEIFQNYYPWDFMMSIKEQIKESTKVYIILTDHFEPVYLEIIYRLARDFNFRFLPIGSTNPEILDYLNNEFLGTQVSKEQKRGVVATFMSSSTKDGATTVAVNTALSIARHSNLEVGLFDLNLLSPSLNDCMKLKSEGKSIITLLPDLAAEDLDSFTLKRMCCQYDMSVGNLMVLTGSNRRDTIEDFRPEYINYLINAARKTFDVLICDVHTFPNNAATLTAIKESEHKFVVAQPNVASYMSWLDWYESFWKLTGVTNKDFRLIVNRYTANGSIKPNDLESLMKLKLSGKVSNVTKGAGIEAVNLQIPLLDFSESLGLFTEEIYKLGESIVAGLGEGLSPYMETSKKRFKLFGG